MTTPTPNNWATDVPTSMPVPVEQWPGMPKVDLGGFMFTINGIAHDVTESELEDIYTPRFAPPPVGSDG